MAVADAALPGVVTPVEILDAHVAVLDDAIAMSPEERPDLAGGGGYHERERVVLHRSRALTRRARAVQRHIDPTRDGLLEETGARSRDSRRHRRRRQRRSAAPRRR